MTEAAAPDDEPRLIQLERKPASSRWKVANPARRLRAPGGMAWIRSTGPSRMAATMPSRRPWPARRSPSGEPVPDPVPVLHVRSRVLQYPIAVSDLERTPDGAKPIVQAARDLERRVL